MEYVLLAVLGVAVGAANVMPGVSGATLAVIFRVYDRLIAAINGLFTEPRDSLKFLLPFGLGMVVGIIALGSAIDMLIDRFAFQTAAFIAGLMAGSMPFLYQQAISRGPSERKPTYYAAAVGAAIVIIILAFVVPTPSPDLESAFGVGTVLLLFAGGALTAAAMVIPGVSGAMVLILLGLFPLAMHTINLIREYLMTPFDFVLLPPILRVVVPLGLGIATGVLLASRLIDMLLKKYFSLTYFIILGLVFGTIFALFNEPENYRNYDGYLPLAVLIAGVLMFIVGLVIALMLGNTKKLEG